MREALSGADAIKQGIRRGGSPSVRFWLLFAQTKSNIEQPLHCKCVEKVEETKSCRKKSRYKPMLCTNLICGDLFAAASAGVEVREALSGADAL